MNLFLFLKNILQLVLSPTNAWKDIEREEVPVNTVVERGLYPMMAIMLVTVFIRPIYGLEDFDLIKLLQTALGQFVALFVAMYIARAVMERMIPSYNRTGGNDPVAVGNVTAYGTGLMTFIQLIENILPVELTVMQLLPAFAAVCIWKSNRYLDLEQQGERQFMLVGILSLIMPVIIINILMNSLIN